MTQALMGAAEANTLIGRWFNLVGSEVQFLNAPTPTYQAPQPVYAPPPVYVQEYRRGNYGGEQREEWAPEWHRHHKHHRHHRPEVHASVRPNVGNWYSIIGKAFADGQFPPRNGLEERGNPTRADREILPMSTGGTAVPFKVSAQITSRPQRVAFRPERVMISNGGTAFGSADWIVNDISIGNRSQFAQSGQVPGDMFAINAVDSFISFETAQTAMDIVMTVTYVGGNVDPGSCPFYGSILGTSAVY